jgi:hypothetical protein
VPVASRTPRHPSGTVARRLPGARRAVAAVLATALTGALAVLGAGPASAAEFTVDGGPSVPGSAYLGQAVTVSLDAMTISPTPASVEVNWFWVDGTPRVDDPTDLQYVPTAADVGKTLYAQVWLHGPSGEAYVAYSNWTGAVAVPGFASVPALTVTGSGVVGSPLTVEEASGSWSPAPESLAYVWFRYPSGTQVAQGTGPAAATYTPTTDDIGSTLWVRVTATRTGTVTNVQDSTASTTVHLGSFDGVGRPTVTGSGTVGTPFTATFDATGVTPSPASVTFQWFTTDGTPLAGADSATFVPGLDLVGRPLYVQATLTAPGHQPYQTLGSDYTRTVSLASFTPGAAPVVVGRNVLGGSLTATLDDDAWSPRPTSLTYQWFAADGTPLAGADTATLVPTPALVGTSVYVVTTAHADGHQPYEIASAPTGLIAAPGVATSTPTAVSGDTVDVEVWGLLLDTEYALELHSTPVALATVRSSAQGVIRTTVTLPAGTPAGEHHVVVLLDGTAVASVPITIAAAPVITVPVATPPQAAAPAAAPADPARRALATTGAEGTPGLLAVVALLLAAGTAAVRVSARNRTVSARR